MDAALPRIARETVRSGNVREFLGDLPEALHAEFAVGDLAALVKQLGEEDLVPGHEEAAGLVADLDVAGRSLTERPRRTSFISGGLGNGAVLLLGLGLLVLELP